MINASRWIGVGLVVILAGLVARPASADDFDKIGFGLRLSSALSRFSSYADVASVGGASAGSQWSSSVNPASTDWKPIGDNKTVSFSPQFAAIAFDEGSNLYVTAQSLTIDLGDFGSIQPALAQAFSNETALRNKLDFDYDLYLGQIQWGKKLDDQWAVGFAFAASQSDLSEDFATFDFIDAHSDAYNFRAGVLHAPADHWLVGLTLDGGWTRTLTDTRNFLFGGANTSAHDTTWQFTTKAGVSYEYADDPQTNDSAIYFDYHYSRFWDSTGHLTEHSFHGGVDHEFMKGLWGRLGGAVDARGNLSATTGIGIYPNDWLTIDIAYQWGFFPELSPEFGGSNAVVVSVSIAF
ncbi:MAG: hypothetical protein GC162_18440 [Planctomycetes bacterium]|nr:hypothetical protein [Planctomycetota bacterium]